MLLIDTPLMGAAVTKQKVQPNWLGFFGFEKQLSIGFTPLKMNTFEKVNRV